MSVLRALSQFLHVCYWVPALFCSRYPLVRFVECQVQAPCGSSVRGGCRLHYVLDAVLQWIVVNVHGFLGHGESRPLDSGSGGGLVASAGVNTWDWLSSVVLDVPQTRIVMLRVCTYDFTGQNVTLLKKYPKSNFLDHDSMFFGLSAPKIGKVLTKTFSKGSFTRFTPKNGPRGGGGAFARFRQTWH